MAQHFDPKQSSLSVGIRLVRARTAISQTSGGRCQCRHHRIVRGMNSGTLWFSTSMASHQMLFQGYAHGTPCMIKRQAIPSEVTPDKP